MASNIKLSIKGGNMLNHRGTQKIETERLILRQFTLEDAAHMYKNWASHEIVTKHLSWPTHTSVQVSEKVISNWIQTYEKMEYYEWGIEFKVIGEVIGSICLCNVDSVNDNAEVGYCIGDAFWNQGMMTEAVQAILKFGFEEIGLARIFGRHAVDNAVSGCVLKKCGFIEEGIQRKSLKNGKGILKDCKCYAILKNEE